MKRVFVAASLALGSSALAAGPLVLGCSRHGRPVDVVEVTSAELNPPSTNTAEELSRRAAELHATTAREQAEAQDAARVDRQEAQRQAELARIHQQRAETELQLRARVSGIEEQLEAYEETDVTNPQVASLIQRREQLLALIDRVRSAPDDAWPSVRVEVAAVIGDAD